MQTNTTLIPAQEGTAPPTTFVSVCSMNALWAAYSIREELHRRKSKIRSHKQSLIFVIMYGMVYMYKIRIIQKLHVSWNKILKVIMNVLYYHSASIMLFLVSGLNIFYITRRKLVFNFRKIIRESKNVLVNNFSKNTVGNNMFKHWSDISGQ